VVRQRVPGARIIYVGSADAYGTPLSLPISEAHPLNPVNTYAISKAAADHYCAYLHRAFGVDVVRMRPFNHSGPRQEPAFFLPSCAKQIAEIEAGVKPPVMQVGNLLASRDFSHVHDVVRAFEAAALRGTPGEAYNVCMGKSYTMQSALDAMLKRSTVAITTELDPARMRPADVPGLLGANSKLRAETGWAPEKTFDDLIDDLLGYWRRRVITRAGWKISHGKPHHDPRHRRRRLHRRRHRT
jgi:GDP-4-dehydro-6-deoxy-D-mannose reductase